jgi:hypothetical protein
LAKFKLVINDQTAGMLDPCRAVSLLSTADE